MLSICAVPVNLYVFFSRLFSVIFLHLFCTKLFIKFFFLHIPVSITGENWNETEEDSEGEDDGLQVSGSDSELESLASECSTMSTVSEASSLLSQASQG
jgi:hypothetical protein